MKKFTPALLLLMLAALITMAFALPVKNTDKNKATETAQANTTGISWISIQDLNNKVQDKSWKKGKKKVIIDLYTDWCGWCKRMDANTFSDPAVAEYVNKNFYAVKLDAETTETIFFGDKEYKFVPGGRKGTNEIAFALGSVNGGLGYPTIVFLDEEMNKVMVSPGYKDANGMKKFLVYVKDEHYKSKTWEEFGRVYDETKGGAFSD